MEFFEAQVAWAAADRELEEFLAGARMSDLGPDVYNREVARRREALVQERRDGSGVGFPTGLVAIVAAILLLLALNEHLCGRLTWRRLVREEGSA